MPISYMSAAGTVEVLGSGGGGGAHPAHDKHERNAVMTQRLFPCLDIAEFILEGFCSESAPIRQKRIRLWL
jgi:hypothetical protein